MVDFKIDKDKNLEVRNFGLQITTDESEYLLQKLKIALSIVKGEYYLDVDLGIPYLTEIAKKNPNLILIQNLFRKKILAIPGIAEIIELNLDFSNVERKLYISFTVRTDEGEIITGSL